MKTMNKMARDLFSASDAERRELHKYDPQSVEDFIHLLVGRKVEYMCCEAEILDIGFTGGMILHAMGCTRVIQNNDILISTLDYQAWDEKTSTNNDEWYNVKKYNDKVVGGTVLSASMNAIHDLTIMLDNGVMIQCLVANAYPHYRDEWEQWVLFENKEDQSGRFLTVYSKGIDF